MISRSRWRVRERVARPLLIVTILNLLLFTLSSAPVVARTISAGAGLSVGLANTLYCQLAGCTMTGGVTFSGVTNDITAAAGQDVVVLGGSSTGSVQLQSPDGTVDIGDGTTRGGISSTSSTLVMFFGTKGTNDGQVQLGNAGTAGPFQLSTAGNQSLSIKMMRVSDSGGDLFNVYGEGMLSTPSTTALAISGTPDVTRAPASGSTGCRISAASGGQSWTPAETSAADGMGACCVNTGANSITITASAGVFEGGGGAVAQWKTICMDYVSDRWVQRGSISP